MGVVCPTPASNGNKKLEGNDSELYVDKVGLLRSIHSKLIHCLGNCIKQFGISLHLLDGDINNGFERAFELFCGDNQKVYRFNAA